MSKTWPWAHAYPPDFLKKLEVPEVPLYQILENTAARFPAHTAVIYGEAMLTYQELKERVDRLAAAWKQLGLSKGDRVGLMLPNLPDYVISYYAAQKLGCTVVQVNPLYTIRELSEMVRDIGMRALVAETSQAEKALQLPTEHLQFLFLSGEGVVAHETSLRLFHLQELIATHSPLDALTEVDVREDVAVIQFTGGTTGKMKGAMLTHYNLVANVIQSYLMYREKYDIGRETTLIVSPLYHVYAMTAGMNLSIYAAARMVLMPRFEVNSVLEAIRRWRPTVFPGVPAMYNAFVQHPGVQEYGLDCLKICASGSAPLPVEVLRRFEELTGTAICEGYGLSETSPSTHRNPFFGKRKVGSIGIPLPGTYSKVVDDHGQEVPVGEVGELVIQGPQVMKGYWNQPEETARAIRDGWFYTGDLARMDEEGYFYIVGRKKEMIITGGFNVYPVEVEGVLYAHPDVKEAAVVGLPDPHSGERIKAFVVPKEGRQIDVEALRQYCYEQLTRYKVPREFEVRSSLPRNSVGKLLKRVLLEEEQEKQKRDSAGG